MTKINVQNKVYWLKKKRNRYNRENNVRDTHGNTAREIKL